MWKGAQGPEVKDRGAVGKTRVRDLFPLLPPAPSVRRGGGCKVGRVINKRWSPEEKWNIRSADIRGGNNLVFIPSGDPE